MLPACGFLFGWRVGTADRLRGGMWLQASPSWGDLTRYYITTGESSFYVATLGAVAVPAAEPLLPPVRARHCLARAAGLSTSWV